ncbi:MAG: OmpA family protein, partial [Myxococcota bacterium]
ILKEIEGRDFQVEGHTDNVPMKGGSNWELAASRAMAVVRTMLGAGLSPQRVSAASYGEHKPTASNDDANGRQANRRIEIVIIPDLSRLPGFEQLQRLSN